MTSHFAISLDVELRATILRKHAVRHGMAVVFADSGGPTGGVAAAGGSAIWSETGELLVRLGATGKGIAMADKRAPSGQRARS